MRHEFAEMLEPLIGPGLCKILYASFAKLSFHALLG